MHESVVIDILVLWFDPDRGFTPTVSIDSSIAYTVHMHGYLHNIIASMARFLLFFVMN